MGERKSTPLLDELMAVSKHISGGNEHQPQRSKKDGILQTSLFHIWSQLLSYFYSENFYLI